MTEQQLDCALDLMRRLPPQQIEKNLSDLIDLVTNIFLKPIGQNKRSLLYQICSFYNIYYETIYNVYIEILIAKFVMFLMDDMFRYQNCVKTCFQVLTNL